MKNKIKLWWSNLGKCGRIVICLLAGCAIATAIAVPTIIAINNSNTNKRVISITIDSTGIKTHNSGDQLDLTGIKIKAYLSSGTDVDVEKNKVTFNPAEGSIVNTTHDVSVAAAYEGVSKNFNVKVNDPTPTTYTLTLMSNPSDIGTTLTGAGSYVPNTQVTVTASAVSGYNFLGWYDGTEKKSTDLSFTYTTGNSAKTLTAKFEQDKAFESCSWSYISDACNTLEDADFTENAINVFCNKFTINGSTPTSLDDFVSAEKNVTVNNQVHKVRVIGTKHDKDTNDKSLALTFEFANLISDAEGNSLAYLWNDTNDTSSANYDYTNSSIRYALTGSGNNNGHGSTILAGVKDNTNWKSSYKDKTIYSMLPKDLTNNLKTVKKSVGTTSGYTETEYSDKLFMPSTIELGFSSEYDKGFGSTYSYYKNATSSTDASRIKKQVNGSTVCTNYASISSGSGHAYSGTAYNYAGYNYKNGGYYWLRSPNSGDSDGAWGCYYDGYVYRSYYVYYNAYGVAPAFCL